MKIGIFGTQLWEQDYLKSKLGEAHELYMTDKPITADQLPDDKDFEVLSVFVGSVVDKAVIDAFPNLKFIATRSTGYDHIDLKACAERGIAVSNVPTYGENTVAEQAFALLLALSRRIYDSYEQVREEGSFSHEDLQGFDLKGKTIGVIGTGHIGRYAIKMAKGFSMEVLAFDVHPDEDYAKEAGFTYATLEELLKSSDVVTIHVPYLPATHHLLNEERIAMMKEGAVLINTARGAIVDTKALVKALLEKRLAGAGLDVLEEEGVTNDEFGYLLTENVPDADLNTVLANHALVDMRNVIVTPHNAFNTREALMRILDTTIENVGGFESGSPVNAVSAS